jgi:WD40 repeat protein
MIQRRHFLGTAAIGLAQFALPQRSFAITPAADLPHLNWRCDVIETTPHTRSKRNPVVTGVDVRAAGDLIAVVGDDHFIFLYDVAQKRFTHQALQHSDWVRAAKFSPDGTQLATAGNDRRLLIANVDDLETPVIEKKHPVAVIDVAFSNDGSKIATVGFDHKLRIFDARDGQKIGEMGCACNDNHTVAFTRDGTWIAAGGRCGTIKVWDTETQSLVTTFKHHRQRVRSLRFTEDRRILSVADDQRICLTDPSQPDTAIKLPRQAGKLFAAQILGNEFFATSGSNNMITLWSLSEMTAIGLLQGHTGTVSCLSATDGMLVSGGFDTTFRIWKPELDTLVNLTNGQPGFQDRQTRMPDGWRGLLK